MDRSWPTSRGRARGPWTVDRQAEQRMSIVDHGNPGACQDTLATAPPCANDGVLGELLATLDTFGRLTGLVDDVGRIAPKSGADCLADAENAEDQKNLTGAAKTETRDTAARRLQLQHPVHSRDEAECLPDNATRGALTVHGVALLGVGASDPRSMSALAARRAWFQSSHGAARDTGGGAVGWSTTDDLAPDIDEGRPPQDGCPSWRQDVGDYE
ncbi:hypothetical protein EDB83DRAFT_2322609 [Lactarius deliciosus]|nr:hypothetical protein EDB83DRAFT_2322609 [Lactarius deliciosus]